MQPSPYLLIIFFIFLCAKSFDPKISKQFLFRSLSFRLHSWIFPKSQTYNPGKLWIQLISPVRNPIFPALSPALCAPHAHLHKSRLVGLMIVEIQRSVVVFPCSIGSWVPINLTFFRSQRKSIDSLVLIGRFWILSSAFYSTYTSWLGFLISTYTFPPGCAWCCTPVVLLLFFLIQLLYFFSLYPSIDFYNLPFPYKIKSITISKKIDDFICMREKVFYYSYIKTK